jgi:hypothetical protein
MIQESDIKINSGNVQRWITYLEEAKDLNAFVKANFGKEEISGMSIAPIIKDLHKENQIIEKAIAEYKKRSGSVFEDGEYYITEYDSEWSKPYKHDGEGEVYIEVIHVLKGSKRGSNRRKTIERFRYHKYSSGHVTIDADGPSFNTELRDQSMNTYIDLFYTGHMTKSSEIMWEKCKRIYESVAHESFDF